jgi:hypothetical protein
MMFPTTASAQRPGVVDEGPPPAEGESKGDPWYGYVATGFLAFAVLFIVAKSARR